MSADVDIPPSVLRRIVNDMNEQNAECENNSALGALERRMQNASRRRARGAPNADELAHNIGLVIDENGGAVLRGPVFDRLAADNLDKLDRALL